MRVLDENGNWVGDGMVVPRDYKATTEEWRQAYDQKVEDFARETQRNSDLYDELERWKGENERLKARVGELESRLVRWRDIARPLLSAIMGYCENECVDESLCDECSLAIQPTLDNLDALLNMPEEQALSGREG
jgi:hypothetical protein